MDFEPYDEAKHGTPGRKQDKWDAFFDALRGGPQVLSATMARTARTVAYNRGVRVSIQQLPSARVVVKYVGEKA